MNKVTQHLNLLLDTTDIHTNSYVERYDSEKHYYNEGTKELGR